MRDLEGKVAAITGAASGIGRSLAVALAKQGCHLGLADVHEDGLEETAQMVSKVGARVCTSIIDVSKRDRVESFAKKVVDEYGGVQVAINNAGVALAETVSKTTYEDFEWIMGINFWGVVYGTKAFLPYLRNESEAHLVNISSAFGLIALPTQAAYNASKFAVRGFTEAVRQEMSGSGVGVTCVHPGGIKTNIVRNARFHKGFDGSTNQQLSAKKFEHNAWTTASQAADAIVRGIKRNKPRVLIGVDAMTIDAIQRIFPAQYDSVLFGMVRPLLRVAKRPIKKR